MRLFLNGWKSISASFIAGAFFSFPVSWLACVSASGILATPVPNAILGIVVSFIVYSTAFALITKQPIKSVVYRLALKTGLETSARGMIHVGLMSAGFAAASASPISQLIAGLAGHLSIPFFFSESQSLPRK